MVCITPYGLAVVSMVYSPPVQTVKVVWGEPAPISKL